MADLTPSPTRLKKRQCVTFSTVEVYYFDRTQGFICVPSQGGSTLGMQAMHWGVEEFSVNSHQYLRLLERYLLILRKYRAGKLILRSEQVDFLEKALKCAPEAIQRRVLGCWNRQPVTADNQVASSMSPDSVVERESDSNLPNVQHCPHLTSLPTVRRSTVCEDPPIEEEDERMLSVLDCYFLPLLSVKKRRVLLRRSGMRTVDPTERIECQAIRLSRDICGCSCTDGVCLPNQCQCAINGIKCQMDRLNFPCPCTSASVCQNPQGRIEFNPIRVRAHYLHTRMRLEMEKDQAPSLQDERREEPLAKRQRLNEPASATKSSTDQMTTEFNNELQAQPKEFFLNTTTVNGGCKDCEEDRYVHLIVQKFVTGKNEQSSDVNPSDLDVEPMGSTTVEKFLNSNDVTASDDAIQCTAVNKDSTLQLVGPAPEAFCDDKQVIANGHPEAAYTNEPGEHMNCRMVDPLLCTTSPLTDIFPYLSGNVSETFEVSTCPASFGHLPDAELILPVPNELQHTSEDEPSQPDFAVPVPALNDSRLFLPSNGCEITDSSDAVRRCTLEPISSLFASCSTLVASDSLIVSALPANLITSEERPNSQVREIKEPPVSKPIISDLTRSSNKISCDPVLSENCTTENIICSFDDSSADTGTANVNPSISSDKLNLTSPNSCSEIQDSSRNTNGPSSSPYLESVRA
ncbi:Cysteine/serine-rich nuclear protein 2 [Fasciolopsis buskii]|uniref:Cysteine/serine-rich nuclear protein 2 n=1 Tax=Fasciolopsis buskii TaxID=27845 RepID=A0A8E0VG32_9TREM|nr:Cysteine/serine-rich nuclear protein 2 [Fasciolopsis buski]